MTDGTDRPPQSPEEWDQWEREQLESFATALRGARKARGMSMQALAEAVGQSRDVIWNAESTKRLTRLPSATLVMRYAAALGVAPSDLVPGFATVDARLLHEARARLFAIRDALGPAYAEETP
ncbi:helix-turn-helix domain-containing protein [Nocardia sp. NPDC004260]